MIPQRAVLWLIVGALGLPVVLCVLIALSRLLVAMQDQAGADCLARLSVILFAVWAIDLIALVILQAINSLDDQRRNPPKA